MRNLLLIVISVCLPALVYGSTNDDSSVYDLPSSQVAIQPRKFEMNKSALLSVGYIPTDSFNRGITVGGSYRHALASYMSLEGTFIWVSNQKTSLESDLNALNVNVQNVGLGGVLDFPKQIYMVGLHYSPLYSKSLLFNSKLVYSENSIFLGVGTINFNSIGFKQMVAPGIASRFYFGPRTALVGYFRDFFYMDEKRGVVGIIDFGIGFEMKFGGERNQRSERSSDEASDEN